MFGSALPSPWFRALLFAATYFLCAQIGNFLTPPGRTDVIFWLPAGLYVAVLLLNEPRHWGWFMAAALPANLIFDLLKGTSWYLVLAFYAANTLQAALGAWLVHTFVAKPTRLRTVKEFFGFLALAGIFATALGAIVGAGVLHAAGLSEDFLQSVKTWWGSCAMAVLLFSPLVLVWRDHDAHSADLPPATPMRPRRIVEAICLYGGLTLGTWVIFLMSEGVTTPYKFRTLPFLVWAGLRFGRRGAAAANLIYATLVVYSAGYSQVQPTANLVAAGEVTFTVQTFLVVAALVGLVPAITLTERDATMVKLSESEAHYRNLTEGAFEGVCISDQGRVIDVSNQLLNMIGYTRDEVIGRQMTEFNTPESRAAVAAAVQAEKEATYGVVLQRKDGSTFPCEVRAKMVRLGGRSLRMTALRDITERVKAEEALRSSEARLRAVSDNLPNGLVYQVVREPDGTMRFLHVSAGVERTHGITAEAVLRDPRLLYEQILPEDRARLVAAEERSFATLSIFDEIMRIRRSDGEIRWVRLCSAPRRKPDGRVIWDGIEIDITESKRSEEALRKNQRMLATLMANLPGLVYRCRNDADWTMEFVSEGSVALTGYRPEDLLQNRVTSFAALIVPEDRPRAAQLVQAALKKREVFELTYRIHAANGEEKWVWERGQGVFAPDGTLLMLEGFISDITGQRRAEAEREAATKREQKVRAEFTRQLIASQEAERTRIAREIHDHLGQLLTALKLDLRSLERRASVLSDTDLQSALLGKIGSAKELADETITSVQKIASELRPGILDRLGLAAAIEAEAQTFAARTGVTCHCAVPEATPPIPQDRAIAAFRIFQEIMTNVARHAHATEVDIQLALDPTRLELTVADNGVGLADQHFHNPKSFGLLGMMERAEIIGGQIEFRKRAGGSGTVVAVRLPFGENKPPNA
jgi:PAS domain S-box-containing protein